jgi:class 3 adenylate cyclase
MATFTLDKKLIILVMLVSVVALSITAYFSFNYAGQILKERAGDQLIGESSTRGHSVELLFESRIKEIQVLANDPMIQILVNDLKNSKDKPNFQIEIDGKRRDFLTQVQAFQNLVGFSIGLEDVKIIGDSGIVFFSLGHITNTDYSNNSLFTNGMKKAFVSFEPDSNGKKMVVATPIFAPDSKRGDKPIGVVIAKMRTAALDQILLNRSGLGETGETYLVNSDKLMITESRFIENAVFKQPVDSPPVELCFSKNEQMIGFYPDYRGVSIYGSSHCAKDLGFVLLAEIDEAETVKPIVVLQNRIFQTGLIITAGMAIVAFALSKQISRPLIKLKNAVNEISKGNFDVQTDIKSKDEIGELSASFDYMAKKLRESIFEIKQKEDVIKQQEEILLNFSDTSENSCVCLIDIKDSTRVTSNLSDSESSKLYSIFLNYMATIVRKHNGTVVKNIGDALLFCFHKIDPSNKDSLKNVLNCCLEMTSSHQEVNRKLKEAKLPSINYKISATYGSVRVAKIANSDVDDIFGTTVNRCAKINPLSPPNGFVIGQSLYEIVDTLGGYIFEKLDQEVPNEHGFAVYVVHQK